MSDEDFDISIHTWIPRSRYKTLRAQADAQNIGIGHLVRAIIIAAVPAARIPLMLTVAERDDYITRRNAEGANDVTIADELGVSKSSVSIHRKRLGISPARKHREQVTA